MDEDSPTMQAAFEIIANVGGAKSLYLEAVEAAKEGKFDEAQDFVKQADDAFLTAHNVHLKLLQVTAQGDGPDMNLILLHAEDQMMGTEIIRIMANDFIDVYRRINQ